VNFSLNSPTSPLVEIIPLGLVEETACAVVEANLLALMNLPSQFQAPWLPPDFAHIKSRNQFNAASILQVLSRERSPNKLRLAMTALDLCLPIFSYVFGEAVLGGYLAVVSLYRLGRGSDGGEVPSSLFYERLAKVGLHEVSHALGVPHCREKDCLMHFSQGLQRLDSVPLSFCPKCQAALHRCRQNLVERIA
jgi:archaemetzincin